MKQNIFGKAGLIVVISLFALFVSGCFFDVYEDAKAPVSPIQVGTTTVDVTPEALPQVGTTSSAQPEVTTAAGTTTQTSASGLDEIVGTATEPIVGGDRDSHGCIGSAGYSWCEVKQKCLRPWEETCAN